MEEPGFVGRQVCVHSVMVHVEFESSSHCHMPMLEMYKYFGGIKVT